MVSIIEAFLDKFRPKEFAIVDINPPIYLYTLLENENDLVLKSQVKQALAIATTVFMENDIPLQSIVGYYLTDTENMISHLEVRGLPKAIAYKIGKCLREARLGSVTKCALYEDEATVGLPYPVTRFKQVPIIDGDFQEKGRVLLSNNGKVGE